MDKQDPVEGEDEQPGGVLPEEISRKIDFLFEDTEGALKKGFSAIGFKIAE